MLRRDLAVLVDTLLEETKEGDDLSLDHLAARLFALHPTQGEIDEILIRLETHGRSVGEGAKPLSPKDRIGRVLEATRALRTELSRAPTETEVAERAGLTHGEVRATRLLLRVMRGT